jgi:4-amino-4-deoxy-L-arabinose transferase-like glycosyltransferase
MEKILTKRNTVVIVLLLTLVKAYLAATLQLHPDEAYYWLWSRRLDLGYYDHSPFIAYFIWLTTIFSQTELWVRLSGIIVSVAISFLCWILAMQLFGEVAVAAGSVLLLNLYPLNFTGSIIMTPDIPSLFFWALAVYAFWQVVRTGEARYWYWTGLLFGLSLLSKYTAVLFAPCIFLFVVMTDERRWLKTVHPYLAFLMGMACFLPVVYWNYAHDWISFRFQFGHGLGGQTYSLGRVLEFFGGQALVASPFGWFFGMIATAAYLFSRDRKKLFICLMSLPVFAFFAFSSLKRIAGPNWPAFAYFTLSIATTKFFLDGLRLRRALWAFSLASALALSLVVILHASFNFISLHRYSKDWAVADATNWFYGYRELGRYIMEKHPEARIIMTQSHQLSAEIIYYTRDRVFTTIDPKITRASQFNLWQAPPELVGAPGLYVYADTDDPGPVREYFHGTGEPEKLSVMRAGFPLRTYKLIPCAGYVK